MKALYLLPLLFLATLTLASADQVPTIVTGHVYLEGTHDPVSGIDVTVTCTHNEIDTIFQDISDNTGMYAVEYTVDQCQPGDMVNICAGEDNCENVMVNQSEFWKNIVYKNFEIPEFTWVAAGTALIGAGLGFMLLRKKN